MMLCDMARELLGMNHTAFGVKAASLMSYGLQSCTNIASIRGLARAVVAEEQDIE